MQAKAERMAMECAEKWAPNTADFLAAYILKHIPLAALLTAEADRDWLKREQAAWRKFTNEADATLDKAEKEVTQLRADLAQLRRNVGTLYEWFQGNTSLTGKQKEAANYIFEQLDKGVKEGK